LKRRVEPAPPSRADKDTARPQRYIENCCRFIRLEAITLLATATCSTEIGPTASRTSSAFRAGSAVASAGQQSTCRSKLFEFGPCHQTRTHRTHRAAVCRCSCRRTCLQRRPL